MDYLIKTYSNENDIVLDFAMGSGTTGVACKNLNRNFIGIEKEKEYFDIAQKRIKENNVNRLDKFL
jgi:site-specific DNA-methyltransferase (adenine-specific)